MFLNIYIYFIILKTYDQQFTLTTKKHCISSLRQRPRRYDRAAHVTHCKYGRYQTMINIVVRYLQTRCQLCIAFNMESNPVEIHNSPSF